jgi:hypothetical protein
MVQKFQILERKTIRLLIVLELSMVLKTCNWFALLVEFVVKGEPEIDPNSTYYD